MTPQQRTLARHALGIDYAKRVRGLRTTYRNRFFAAPGSTNHALWMNMCAAGLATHTSGNRQYAGNADLFCLTSAGAAMALNPGERLCTEDFPPTGTVALSRSEGGPLPRDRDASVPEAR